MLEKVLGYRAWCTHSIIKTNQLMLTKDIMPILRMRENFLIHTVGKYKDF